MKKRILPTWLASLALLAVSVPAQSAPGCNQCKDLPRLYRELLEQQFLRDKFNSWVTQAYYPTTVDNMQASARNALNDAMQHGGLGSQGNGGSGGNGGANPDFGTDLNSGKCGLVQYVKDKQGKLKEVPVTPDQVRGQLCKPLAEFVLAHEGKHQASCRDKYQHGKSSDLGQPEFVAKDDVTAYQAGIEVLRAHIAKMSKDCGWVGSSNPVKPDGTATVPTPSQITELSANTRKTAASLKKATRKGAAR